MLDGHSSLDEIKQRFEQQFARRRSASTSWAADRHAAPQRPGDRRLPGQGPQLLKRARRAARQAAAARSPTSLRSASRASTRSRFLTGMYPLRPLVLHRWAATAVHSVWPVGARAGGGAVRRVSAQAAGVPPVLRRPELDLAGRGDGRHQGACTSSATACRANILAANATRWACMLLVFTPCLYCNVVRFLDAAQQMAARRSSAPPACTSSW